VCFSVGYTLVRPSPLAFASIVATFTLSSGASPFHVPRATTQSVSVEGTSARHATTARVIGLGPAALRFGRSIGSPTEGRLVGGLHVDETPYLRVIPAYAAGDARWGLEPLVAMIDRAARTVRRRFPDAIVSIGHLSRQGGGDIDRHRSHESGRDADISFFLRSASGRQLLPSHFVAFRGDGTAGDWPGAYFDEAKNWALVSAMVSDPEAHVTHLFIAAPLRARLLAYAERTGAPATLRMRAAEAMQQPRGALPHDDHFHVRIGCPAHMVSCVENPALRDRQSPTAMTLHGRRGGAPQGWATPAPKRAPLLFPSRPSVADPSAAPDHAPGAGDAPTDDAPPALMPAPIDDVDG
jgi:penicillin-insensitive murein endopeptidase